VGTCLEPLPLSEHCSPIWRSRLTSVAELVASLAGWIPQESARLLAEKSMYRLFYVLAALRAPRLARGCRTGLIARVLQEVTPCSPTHAAIRTTTGHTSEQANCPTVDSTVSCGRASHLDQASYTQMVRHLRQYESLGFDPIADQVSSAANLLSSLMPSIPIASLPA